MALVSPDLALDEKPPFTWGSSQLLCQDHQNIIFISCILLFDLGDLWDG